MGIFATRARKGAPAEVAPDATATPGVQALPARFEAVGERLAAGHDASAACATVGLEMARDGADLGEALDGLRDTFARVLGGEPDFRAVRALGTAWSEETLGYLHQLSCESPLTGLASLAHLRARLSEVYREAEQGATATTASHALVVIDVPLLVRPSVRADAFETALRIVRLGEVVRLVFPGGETICQVGQSRVVVLVPRAGRLAQRVVVLRDLVGDIVGRPAENGAAGSGRPRIWIEGLPSRDEGAGRLLDELARG